MVFHVTVEEAEDGWFVVECLALPGPCPGLRAEAGPASASQGKTSADQERLTVLS